ncbi:MAG: hypothetical protein FD136_1051 [Chitinophagaceae bacterium]|nr:MAG: hypothetical protein FD136_1051 [Chitinophagaceae bacterium]
MKKICLVLLFSASIFANAQTNITYPESLILVPEKSNFEKTSTYADVMQFLNSIKTMSPNIYVGSIGKSTLEKDIPMVVLANPMVQTPAAAKASGKPVIYIQANIHAGEIEGYWVIKKTYSTTKLLYLCPFIIQMVMIKWQRV